MWLNTYRILAINSQAAVLSLVGIAAIFGSLLLIFLIFVMINRINQNRLKSKLLKQGYSGDSLNQLEVSGEVNAAIGLALNLYFEEIHDTENMKFTIKKVSRTYSPWSSKIYGVRTSIWRG